MLFLTSSVSQLCKVLALLAPGWSLDLAGAGQGSWAHGQGAANCV